MQLRCAKGIKASTKLKDALQASYRLPGARHKFRFCYQRVSMAKYANIFTCKKPIIFLPCDMNLFRVIRNKEENCVNVFRPISDKRFLARDRNERKLSFESFQTNTLYQTVIFGQ